jgi:hypothetical protein
MPERLVPNLVRQMLYLDVTKEAATNNDLHSLFFNRSRSAVPAGGAVTCIAFPDIAHQTLPL